MRRAAPSITHTMATGLEQGALALLGSKSTRTLLALASPAELILLCAALQAAMSAVPRKTPLAGRLASIMAQVFWNIALNTALQAVVVPGDPPLTCLNLLGVFFLGMATQQEDAGVSAQYLLVANLSDALRALEQGSEGLLGIAWALAVVPDALPPPLGDSETAHLARLVTVETFTGFLREQLPHPGMLPTTLLLLYLVAPFVERFPVLARMNRFAVFAVSNDQELHEVSPWLIAACLWALWLADPEPTARAFAAAAGGSVAVLAALDAIRVPMDNDPVPVLVALLLLIQIVALGNGTPP